jgi:DNA-binding response OmpR family regulator
LLSNAFKFTPEGGTVIIDLNINLPDSSQDSGSSNDTGNMILRVEDTGIGIAKENLNKVFDRFFQNDMPGLMVSQGSGIGLSLTKEFVKLHNGTIDVESEPGKGSCFTVRLPLISKGSDEEDDSELDIGESSSENLTIPDEKLSEQPADKSLILLVEDNDDFRFYLKDNLKDRYNLIEAANGKEGLQKASSSLPDLIVSDIMMPEMDGIELCRLLKTTAETSHIPIILLTARMSQDVRQEGYETGADDYITKPFSFEILESRIHNLIRQRERIKKTFQKHFKIEPGEIGITSLDEKLMNKALATVEKHMSDSEFSVEKLSRELGMSRVHLYKKLTALTGKTPIEFIRIMRLKRAAQYLGKSQLTVSEIAFEVGFNDPRYFSRYFKTEFGMLPSQYIQMQKKSKTT